MRTIDTIEALEGLYDMPSELVRIKVTPRLTPSYRRWIERSRFAVLATVGPEGTDGSPRGDAGPVVTIADDRTLLLPDWSGNNRIDSLRNIVRDGRVSLMYLVAGSAIVMRVNGRAVLSDEPGLVARFEQQGKRPRLVIVITVEEAYAQCPKAVARAELWTSGDQSAGLPGIAEMLADAKAERGAAAATA